ncbi:MAG: hypothetical protein GX325_09370 [Peptococcaceae bacterium]|nr:hypothetical protein [Peptococcaceae bacterium]
MVESQPVKARLQLVEFVFDTCQLFGYTHDSWVSWKVESGKQKVENGRRKVESWIDGKSGRRYDQCLNRDVNLADKEDTLTGERGHISVWGRALPLSYVPRLSVAGECPRINCPRLLKICLAYKSRRHRALIQRANEPEEKRGHCLSRVSGELARARG